MPLLAGALTALFLGIAEFFAKWITRKVAVIAAGIAVMATITGILFFALSIAIMALQQTFPMNPALATGIWIMIPDNAAACIAAMLGWDATLHVYRMNVLNVQFSVYAP